MDAKAEIAITVEDGATSGRYVARVSGKPDSEMTYRKTEPGVWTIVHTGVPEALAGLGVGKALVAYMVEDIRRRGFKIIAQCPFTAAMMKRHPEWQDILKTPL